MFRRRIALLAAGLMAGLCMHTPAMANEADQAAIKKILNDGCQTFIRGIGRSVRR
jgi:hypothetical protein